MKLSLASILVLIALPALAQTSAAPTDSVAPTPVAKPGTSTAPPPDASAPPPQASAMAAKYTATLTPEEQKQLADDKDEVLKTNPDLQSEQMDLMQQGMAMQDGSATEEDRQALKEQFKKFLADMHAAMIKLDPSVEPVLKKVEAQVAKVQKEHSADASAPAPQ